jgi:pyridoxamine 5'-phosphate oxidase
MSEAEGQVWAGSTPFDVFGQWLAEATGSEINDPTAMTLATVGADLRPSARMVLLKGVDGPERAARGFVFYTNLGSRKAEEISAHAAVSLLFHWKTLRRQVRIEGFAEAVSTAEADAYFASRPRLSRLGAWASDQSRPLDARSTLERRLAEMEQRYPAGDIPRPAYWSGFRVLPDEFEFWHDMPFRLHDRTLWQKGEAGDWRCGKLYP